ncbi:hypothetical protein [Salinigranum sp.]|uniref:hypothetical protein n=1 Tax=Salinigranum sp. TaxID=1966351 RepID=UPI00356795F1
MEFADRFGATVDVSVPATDAGYFLVRRHPAVDHAEFRRAVAAVVGGADRITLDAPGGFVVVGTRFETAQALRRHPMVDHVGGVTVDSTRLHPPVERVERVGTDTES